MRQRPPVPTAPLIALEIARLGKLIATLRYGYRMKQEIAALNAGISRDTASRIEKGRPGVAIELILLYIDGISPGLTLTALLTEFDAGPPKPEKNRRVSAPPTMKGTGAADEEP